MLRPALLVAVAAWLATGALAQPINPGRPNGPLCAATIASVANHLDQGMTKLVESSEALSISTVTNLVTETDDHTKAVCSGTVVKDLPTLCPKLFLLARHETGGESLPPGPMMAGRMFSTSCLTVDEMDAYRRDGEAPSSYPTVDETPSQLRWMVQVTGDRKQMSVSMWNRDYRRWGHWFDVSF